MFLFLQRPFTCPIDDCHSSYRRKDHLNRHILQHEGKLFACPIENCKSKFSIQGNMTRHVKEIHDDLDDDMDDNMDDQKQHVCFEPGCGKAFRYASRLKKHEESHGNFFLLVSFWRSFIIHFLMELFN